MQLPQLNKQVSPSGLAYHQRGTGPALLLLHGVGMRSESWFQQIAKLQTEFSIFAVDLPGHGSSAPLRESFESVQLQHYVRAIKTFLVEVIGEPCYLCGHSLGALIGAEIAADSDANVSQSLLLSTVFQRTEKARLAVSKRAEKLYLSNEITGIAQTLDRWFGTPPKQRFRPFAWMCYNWLADNSIVGYAKAYKSFANVSGVPEKLVANLNTPTIFMTGTRDPNSTPEMSRSLASLGKPHKATIVKGAGHMLPLTHADVVCEQLLLMK